MDREDHDKSFNRRHEWTFLCEKGGGVGVCWEVKRGCRLPDSTWSYAIIKYVGVPREKKIKKMKATGQGRY